MTAYALSLLAAAILAVEGAPQGHHDGPLQITAVMRQDYHRHTGRRVNVRSRDDSVRVLEWYAGHYCRGADAWTIAARWNAGPDGDRQAHRKPRGRVADYANRVENVFWSMAKRDLAYQERMLR